MSVAILKNSFFCGLGRPWSARKAGNGKEKVRIDLGFSLWEVVQFSPRCYVPAVGLIT